MDQIPSRDKIRIGTNVLIVQKQDQRTGALTEGTVKRILTSSNFHPHGIKVELEGGKIGRVQKIS
ncbi:MAG: YwbE family protein [Candidatus Nitrosotenuis sp.]|nr:MAG: YwbE family protein [Candidatus Nitrosotenuis sp.]